MSGKMENSVSLIQLLGKVLRTHVVLVSIRKTTPGVIEIIFFPIPVRDNIFSVHVLGTMVIVALIIPYIP